MEMDGSSPDEASASTERGGGPQRFGTFGGVFTPTLLTILGVIMYLRTGWIVGNGGLIGALLIVLLSCGITACTALSLSSIATNVQMGAGGPYGIVARSLGLELGGSIGLPLYLSQALAVTMYIFGFRSGWRWLYPTHDPLMVDLVVFGVIFVIAFLSAGLAFRIQYLILGVIGVSLLSLFSSSAPLHRAHDVVWWGTFAGDTESGFTGISFWGVFAVFFPATTGILAGANMSGELSDPRRSIPLGTLASVGLSALVYLSLVVWLAFSAPSEALLENYNIMIDLARWSPLVLAGLLGATFSSALTSLVGAPRILQAFANHRLVPASEWFARRSRSGEPRNAMMLTGVLVIAGLMLRDLNAIAPLITMFFLLTYAVINIVVMIETRFNTVGFRPLFRVPVWVSLLGAVGCVFAMFIINPVFGWVAVLIVVTVYRFLMKRRLPNPEGFGAARNGTFAVLAEWAAKVVARLPVASARAWRINLLTPTNDLDVFRRDFDFLLDLTLPDGALKLLHIASDAAPEDERVKAIAHQFLEHHGFATWARLSSERFSEAAFFAMQTLRSSFFRPNLLFLTTLEDSLDEAQWCATINHARSSKMGVLIYAHHPTVGLASRSGVNVWVRHQGPDWSVSESMRLTNLDLMILVSYVLQRRWETTLRFLMVVSSPSEHEAAQEYLRVLIERARIPSGVERLVLNGHFNDCLPKAPPADLNLFGTPHALSRAFVDRLLDQTGGSCLLVRVAGDEDAFA